MTQPDWSDQLAFRVGKEVRKHRDRLGISAQVLSDRTLDLGMRIERSVIAGLENERRKKISLAEILVLAMALDVAPIVLIFPVGDVESVELLPGLQASPFNAAQWFSGSNFNLAEFFLLRDHFQYWASVEKLRAYRRHADLVNTAYDLWASLQPPAGNRHGDFSRGEIESTSRLLERYAGLLWERRNDMKAQGMLLPPIPDELRDAMDKAELFERLVGESEGPQGVRAAGDEAGQG